MLCSYLFFILKGGFPMTADSAVFSRSAFLPSAGQPDPAQPYGTRQQSGFRPKDPGSAATHFIGFIASIIAMPILLVHASLAGADLRMLAGYSIFMLSMITLYGASTSYHSFDVSASFNLILKKVDHLTIPVLIAGTYTPVCLFIHSRTGTVLIILAWCLAAASMLFTLLWVTCPRWVSSVLYIGMGWSCVFALPSIYAALTPAAFGWLLAGGILYSVGAVIYAVKQPEFNRRHPRFGTHEIFHLFVLAGSLCHYILMYGFLLS